MKLLYLHDGQHEIDKIAFDMGFDVVSYHIEHFDYNVRGSYVGEKTPIWCDDMFEI